MGRKATKTVFKDDRTEYTGRMFDYVIGGVDTFLSGWGQAEGKRSFAFWACESRDREKVLAWVKGRSDIKSVRVLRSSGFTKGIQGQHTHVYVVNEGHPALT